MNNLDLFEQFFRDHLKILLPKDKFFDVYNYALFPMGKAIRPRLVLAVAQDLGNIDQNHLLWASAIEAHHAYSLAHDDLPAMDDDDIRRGRPSLHKQYSEWQAILAGDGLLAVSYSLIEQIIHPKAEILRRFFHWATGPKGLIQGQVMDLQGVQTFEDTIRVHELKTSRLFQLAIVGSALISDERRPKNLLNIATAFGECFQLLDDLLELANPVGEHEWEINPWPKYAKECESAVQRYQNTFSRSLESYPNLQAIIENYLGKIMDDLKDNREAISARVGRPLKGLMELFP